MAERDEEMEKVLQQLMNCGEWYAREHDLEAHEEARKLLREYRAQVRAAALEEAADDCWGHINAEIEKSPELADIPPDDYSRGYRDCANHLALKYRAKAARGKGE